MEVHAISSGDPIVLIEGHGAIHAVGCVAIPVLAHIWRHRVL